MSEAQDVELRLSLKQHLGLLFKRKRLAQNLKLAEVAKIADISQGMLSRIENAQVSTSLETLQKLCAALGVHLAELFKDYQRPEGSAQHVKAGEGHTVIRRGTERGHDYQLLAYQQGPYKTIEPFLVTMDDQSEVFPTFIHPGTEFIHILEGRVRYRHGNYTYELEPGDSLTFDGEIPHGPDELQKVPVRMLSVINYGGQESG